MYGRVVSMPRPSADKFKFTIECEMSHPTYGFTITQYQLFTSVANTHALTLHLQLVINPSNTGNYTFTEPRAQIVQILRRYQSQVQAAAATPCRGRCPQTIPRKSSGVPLITGIPPVRGPYNNAEDDEEEGDSSSNNRSKLDV